MATYAEDYLVDDDILTRQFSGTLSFDAETASSQTSLDGVLSSYTCVYVKL